MSHYVSSPDNLFRPDNSPRAIEREYQDARGNPILPIQDKYFYYQKMPLPGTTQTKAGDSFNVPNKPFPQDKIGIKRPEYSTSTGDEITFKRVGKQVGSYDPYRDTPWQDWTYGVQYYTPYVGQNIKNNIPPVIVPQPARVDVWGNSLTSISQVNRERAKDLTELDIEYSCKPCVIPSASLGTPVPYMSREGAMLNVNAPLPVQLPGEYPNIGQYTAREIGRNTMDYPQPVNAIVEIARRKSGLRPNHVVPNYPEWLSRELLQGFDVV